jgi:alcohol dehydrogenase class IV
VADVVHRPGSLEEAFATVEGAGWVVLRGESSFRASGAEQMLARLIGSGADVHAVAGPMPTVEEADRLIGELRGSDLEGIVAVGGGLVIDTMKTVSLALATGLTSSELLEHGALAAPGEPVRMVAAPTTAGSGAERTPFAVIYADDVKQSVDDPRLLPQTAIVDPLLVRSAPKRVAASAGLDALAHCVESLWACRSTPESQSLAADSLSIVVENLEPAVVHQSAYSQQALAFAASSAGASIAITRTTAAHALSYYLTSRHGISHGHAVALTLGGLIEANGTVHETTVGDPRGVQHVRQAVDTACEILGISRPSEGRVFVSDLVERLGLVPSVDEAAAEQVDRGSWVESVNPERLSNNPRRLTETDLMSIVNAS